MLEYQKRRSFVAPQAALLLLAAVWLSVSLACNLDTASGTPEKPWLPDTPTQYVAEVQHVSEVYVIIDAEGNVMDFGSDAPFGATAQMRYVLRFWDVGKMGGKPKAAIYRVYTPTRIDSINNPENYSEDEQAAIYARSGSPTTEVKVHDLVFSGGTEGKFIGTNSETGKDIFGHLEWDEKLREMHAIFTEDIKQDYLVIADEPFYNWP
jgi:hypothetical protein